MIIKGSVGRDGKNNPEDVGVVQLLLKKAGIYPFDVDEDCGPKTIAAITDFQSRLMKHPDGKVDVGGFTWRKLCDPATPPLNLSPPTTKPDWSGDSAKWSQDKKIESLDPDLRPKVRNILKKLTDAGFQPKVFYAWRSVQVQLKLVQEGHSTVKFSFHNAQKPDGTPNAYAADIVDSRWGWEKEAEKQGFWAALGKAAKEEGLVWGGDWKTFRDVAHVQSRQNNKLAAVKKASGL